MSGIDEQKFKNISILADSVKPRVWLKYREELRDFEKEIRERKMNG